MKRGTPSRTVLADRLVSTVHEYLDALDRFETSEVARRILLANIREAMANYTGDKRYVRSSK